VLDLIKCFAQLFSNHFKREPSMVTTSKMIALRPLFTTLAPFDSGQLFQFSMQLLYKPTHLVLVLNNRRVDRTWGTIGDDPFNVTIFGDYLEKLHFKRDFFKFNGHAVLELFARPCQFLQMNVALFFTDTDQPIVL